VADVAGLEVVHVVAVASDAQGDAVAAQLGVAGTNRRAARIERILVAITAFSGDGFVPVIKHQVYVEFPASGCKGAHVAGGAECHRVFSRSGAQE